MLLNRFNALIVGCCVVVVMFTSSTTTYMNGVMAASSGQLSYCDINGPLGYSHREDIDGEPGREKIPVVAQQRAQPAPDNVLQPKMTWVKLPRYIKDTYVLSVAGGATEYKPNQWMEIVLDTKVMEMQYIGLLLYATTKPGVATSAYNKVGEWSVQNEAMFHNPNSCGTSAVTHKNAELKPLQSRFFFKAPPQGTGDIRMQLIIKQGEQNTGDFWWPHNSEKIILKEGNTAVAAGLAFRAKQGESCVAACEAQDMKCDQGALRALTTADAVDTLAQDTVNQRPNANPYFCNNRVFGACDNATPYVGRGGYCTYHSEKCAVDDRRNALARCDATPPLDRTDDTGTEYASKFRLCVCKAGGARRRMLAAGVTDTAAGVDEAKQVNDDASVAPHKYPDEAVFMSSKLHGAQMLHPSLTLDMLDITEKTVTIQITGPSDRWFSIGFGRSWMSNTYALVYSSPPPAGVKARQDIADVGLSGGWYDAQCQGQVNDYCRYVNTGLIDVTTGVAVPPYADGSMPSAESDANYQQVMQAESYWSCALAGSSEQMSAKGVYAYGDVSPVPCSMNADTKTTTPIIMNSELKEFKLEHRIIGSQIPSSVIITHKSELNGKTTLRVKRDRVIDDERYYDFDMAVGEMPLIWALGPSQVYGMHNKWSMSNEAMTAAMKQEVDPDSITITNKADNDDKSSGFASNASDWVSDHMVAAIAIAVVLFIVLVVLPIAYCFVRSSKSGGQSGMLKYGEVGGASQFAPSSVDMSNVPVNSAGGKMNPNKDRGHYRGTSVALKSQKISSTAERVVPDEEDDHTLGRSMNRNPSVSGAGTRY